MTNLKPKLVTAVSNRCHGYHTPRHIEDLNNMHNNFLNTCKILEIKLSFKSFSLLREKYG